MWEKIGKVIGTALEWGTRGILWFIDGGWIPTLIALGISLAVIIIIGIFICWKKK